MVEARTLPIQLFVGTHASTPAELEAAPARLVGQQPWVCARVDQPEIVYPGALIIHVDEDAPFAGLLGLASENKVKRADGRVVHIGGSIMVNFAPETNGRQVSRTNLL